MRTLVVVPCGAKKIWSEQPSLGAVRAAEAYVGVPFRVNRAYAEVVGDAWVILSAKYGFLAPDELLDGPYEVTFPFAGLALGYSLQVTKAATAAEQPSPR